MQEVLDFTNENKETNEYNDGLNVPRDTIGSWCGPMGDGPGIAVTHTSGEQI